MGEEENAALSERHYIGGVSHSVSQPLPSQYKSEPALPANKQKSNYEQHQRNPTEGVSTMPLTHSVRCHKVQERPRTCSRMKKLEMWETRDVVNMAMHNAGSMRSRRPNLNEPNLRITISFLVVWLHCRCMENLTGGGNTHKGTQRLESVIIEIPSFP